MSDLPLVSVIMPACNAAVYVRRSLESVLNQTYENIEVIVVDDGSCDATPQVVEALAQRDGRLRLIRQPNRGVAAARNRAISAARGTFVAPIDADDVWFPRKLERQVACMREAGPTVGFVYTWWTVIDDQDTISTPTLGSHVEGRIFEALLQTNFVGSASIPLIRRSCLDHVGGYNTSMLARGGQGCEDWDLALRIAEHYEIRVVKECLVGYRKVENSMSTHTAAMVRSHEVMLEDIRRRRDDVTEAFCQRARGSFRLYVARTSYISGDHWGTLHWLYQAWRLDRTALQSRRALFLLLTSLPLAAVWPLTALFWPRLHTWLRLRRFLRARPWRAPWRAPWHILRSRPGRSQPERRPLITAKGGPPKRVDRASRPLPTPSPS